MLTPRLQLAEKNKRLLSYNKLQYVNFCIVVIAALKNVLLYVVTAITCLFSLVNFANNSNSHLQIAENRNYCHIFALSFVQCLGNIVLCYNISQ